jgi:DNA-binding PadR family transcriptional regulator
MGRVPSPSPVRFRNVERMMTMFDRDFWGDFGFGVWGGQEGKGGRRFRWNPLERGDLKFVILRLISDKPMHGYEVMQALEEESGGGYKPSPGSVYPTLQMLEDEGLLRSKEEEGKKIYEITEEGTAYLEEHGDIVERIFDRVGAFANGFFGKDTRELTAAFSRLAQTCFEGTFSGRLDGEAVRKMTETLDGARREIEDVIRARKGSPGRDEVKDQEETE